MINTLNRMFRTGILTEQRPTNAGAPHLASEMWDSKSSPAEIDNLQPATDNLQQSLWAILGRALCIRHVDAGSCNACELELHALNNPYYNLEGAGIKFVASPRHADALLVTGLVSVNMEEALRRTYDAIPDPKLVIAIGDCATCGSLCTNPEAATQNYATRGPISAIIPVNHTIPGCPPAPAAILTGILQALTAATR